MNYFEQTIWHIVYCRCSFTGKENSGELISVPSSNDVFVLISPLTFLFVVGDVVALWLLLPGVLVVPTAWVGGDYDLIVVCFFLVGPSKTSSTPRRMQNDHEIIRTYIIFVKFLFTSVGYHPCLLTVSSFGFITAVDTLSKISAPNPKPPRIRPEIKPA